MANDVTKAAHEIRDPVHTFVRIDGTERNVVDSDPVQRLKHIHQLGLTYCLYPGASHKRFEHSLGVMELASRVYDVVTHPDNVPDQIREVLPEVSDRDKRSYWRRVIRIAALCHDIGHLPFSHAAEESLLPENSSHESLTAELIRSKFMAPMWEAMTPPLRPGDIIKLAVGKEKLEKIQFTGDKEFSDWEAILSEIIVGNAFGVDRMDYLLRDSLHTGVAYGRFDHYRLIDTLRILPPAPTVDGEGSSEPLLGVEEGGLKSAEALLLARYFMFTQVYLHHVRRAYDIHLKEFLVEWLEDGKYPTDLDAHLAMTDNEVLAAIGKAARDSTMRGHRPASSIVNRNHYRLLWKRNPAEQQHGRAFYEAIVKELGDMDLEHDVIPRGGSIIDFPVQLASGSVASARSLSEVLQHVPSTGTEHIFVHPQAKTQAEQVLLRIQEQFLKDQLGSKSGEEQQND